MPNKNEVVSFRVPSITEKILNDLATRRGLSRGELVEQIVLENLDNYRELNEDEQEVVEQLQKRKQEEMYKVITKSKLKEATYMNWVQNTILQAEIRGADKEEIIDILESMKPVADIRGKLDRLELFIEDYENGNVDLNEERLEYV